MRKHQGFTLIELSIVLVIIGLIVGGVLVGRDLIAAAGVRAEITQIEKYRQAMNTFREKYGYLPGDIKDPDASNFGFAARGAAKGQGDGDGDLWGLSTGGAICNICETSGEAAMFWVDLTAAHLIDESFVTAQPAAGGVSVAATGISLYMPAAKIGNGNYIYIYYTSFFGLSQVPSINSAFPMSTSGLTVKQAFNIDKKVDDGMPQSGKITSQHNSSAAQIWSMAGAGFGASPGTATAASASTCADNGNVATVAMNYSIGFNSGNGVNCALSFKF